MLNPIKQTPTSGQLRMSTDPTYSIKRYATARFTSAQATFTTGEDRPLNGGDANGLCMGLPETPAIKWGSALAKNTPPNKHPT